MGDYGSLKMVVALNHMVTEGSVKEGGVQIAERGRHAGKMLTEAFIFKIGNTSN